MTIAFDAATGNKVGSGTTNTWSHTVASSQSNQVLIVSVDAGQSVSGVTYNSVAMTQLGVVNYNTANEHLSLWYLLAPATGTHSIVATVSASTFIIGVSASYYNVAQTSTFGTFASNSGAAATASTNTVVTTSNTQMVVDAVNNGAASTATATASQNKRFQPATSGSAIGDIAATGSNMTLTWSFTSSVWGQVSVAMNPSSSSTNFNTTITEQLTSFSAETTTLKNVNTTITDTQLNTAYAEATVTTSIPVNTTAITEQLVSFSAEAAVSGSQTITEQLVSVDATSQQAGSQTITEQLVSVDATSQQAGSQTITEQVTLASANTTTLQNGNTTITEQLFSFYAEATATPTTVIPPTIPGVSVSMAGAAVQVLEGSFEIDDSISSISTAMFTVRDDTGLNHYTRGQKVAITDSLIGTMYNGFVNTSQENRISPNALVFSKIAAKDNHYLAEKRSYIGPEYTSTQAGAIVTDLLNSLTAEGVTAAYASRRETTATQLATGTRTNTAGYNNTGDGNLEILASGSVYTDTFGPVSMPMTSALKYQAEATATSGGNLYHYQKIWSGSYTIQAGDALNYDIWIASTSPTGQIALDFTLSNGTVLRNYTAPIDAQGIGSSPALDLTGLATNTWYNRFMGLGGSLVGKTIVSVSLGVEGDKVGFYTAYFRNVYLVLFAGGTLNFFTTALQQNPSVAVQNSGYDNVSVTVVNSYDQTYSTAYTDSPTAAGVVKSSIISWAQAIPVGTSMLVESSIENATWQACTNHGAIPSLVPGMNLSAITARYRVTLSQTTPDPTLASGLLLANGTIQVNPSYNGTKTDVIYSEDSQANFNTGSLTSVVATTGGDLTLDGGYRTYDDANVSSQTYYYSNVSNLATLTNRQIYVTNVSGSDSRIRMDWLGTRQNGTIETNVQVSAYGTVGITYRTTGWQNNRYTYAYSANVSLTAINLDRGTNSSSGSGAKTNISTVALPATLTAFDWHRIKVVVSGSNHRVYLDDILYINSTDATYSAAGYCALIFDDTGASADFINFDGVGYCAALTGNRVSASQSLAGTSTLSDSRIFWNQTTLDTTSVLIETSINGGTTYLPAINGAAIPGLTMGQSMTGVALLIRETLTASNATLQPALHAVTAIVSGQLSASGTRVGPSLSLLNVGRLGNSLVAWNSNVPTGTTLGVDVAIDGGSWVDVTAGNGGSIPGLAVQPDPTIDSYNTNTSTNYTSSIRSGGTLATWTYDTTNSRISATGGNLAYYVLNTVTAGDVDIIFDMDQSDAGGIAWRWTDSNNFYEISIQDDTNGNPNRVTLYTVKAGTRTQVAQTTTISFTRGTYHRFRVTMLVGIITVYMDGLSLLTYTDGSPLSAGKIGLRDGTNSTASTARYYQLRVQPMGDDVTAHTVQSRFRLATTTFQSSPQILDHVLAAHGNTIGNGSVIPQTSYNLTDITSCLDDAAKQSNYWWYIDKYKTLYFQARAGIPSPWIASDNPGDFLDANITVTNQSDAYRNRHIVKNVLAPVVINESRLGDGISKSWTFGNDWASAPAITINGVAATVGVKNQDTGRQFYFAVGDPTIIADSSSAIYDALQTLSFVGTGQYTTYSQADDTIGQAVLAALESSSGIVEVVEDGAGIGKAAGDALATARIAQYGILGRTLKATTLRAGLAPGQLLTVFLPEFGVSDGLFLIRSIKTRLTTTPLAANGAQMAWYDIEAVSGPDIGDWTNLYKRNS